MTQTISKALQVLAAAQAARGGAGEGVEATWEHSWPWPPWTTLLLLLLVAAAIAGLYLFERSDSRRRLRWTLAALRITLLGLLLFMMYGWMLRRHRTDFPDLVVALDVTQSMTVADQYANPRVQQRVLQNVRGAGWEEATRLNVAKSLLVAGGQDWWRQLAERYHLQLYLVGDTTRQQAVDVERVEADLGGIEATDTASRLGTGLQDVFRDRRGRPTAAVILLTDGVTTAGPSVSEAAAAGRGIPLFVVGIGDERPPRDVRVSDLLTEDVVFVGDLVNFDVMLHHGGFAGKRAVVRLRRGEAGAVVDQQTVALTAANSPQAVRLSDRPQQPGDFTYVVEAVALPGDVNLANNVLPPRRVQVRDAKLRVLLVQAYPNYEFRALKNLLSRALKAGGEAAGKAIELTTVLQEADLEYADQDATARTVFPVARQELFDYDVVIFGDVNPAFLGQSVMTNLADFVKQEGGGVVFIAGPLFTPLAYRDTPLAELFPFDLSTAVLPDPQVVLSDEFVVQPTPLGLTSPQLQLGDSRQETARIWRQLHGLHWLLEAPDVKPAARVLAAHPQRIGAHGDPLPVILLQFVGAGKVVFHASDETFYWSRYRGREEYFARYWLQTIRYLSRSKLAPDRRTAEIKTDRREYHRRDAVQLTVRFFDERLAPAEDDGVSVMLEQVGAQRRLVRLRRGSINRGEFTAVLSDLAIGDYRVWLAAPDLKQQPQPRTFQVSAPRDEFARLPMNGDDLRRAARRRFYSLQTADRLPGDLPRGHHVRIESLPAEPIWNSSLLAASFIVLITAEWLLRKKAGML